MSATLFVKFLGTALVVPAGYSAYSSGMLGGEFATDSDLDEGLASLAYIHMPDEDEEIEEPAVRADSEGEVAVGPKAVETEARGDAVAEERTVEAEAAVGAVESPKIIGDEKGVKKELAGKKIMSGLFGGKDLSKLIEEMAGENEFSGSPMGGILILLEPYVGQKAPRRILGSIETAVNSVPHHLTQPTGVNNDQPSYAEKYGLTEELKSLTVETFMSKLNITFED